MNTFHAATAWNDTALCKTFLKEKIRKRLLEKYGKEEETCEQFANTFDRWYESKEKTRILFVGLKIFNNT